MKKLTLTLTGCCLIVVVSAQNLIGKLPRNVKKEISSNFEYISPGYYEVYEPNPVKYKYDTIRKPVNTGFFMCTSEVSNNNWKDFYAAMKARHGVEAAARFLPDTTLWQRAFAQYNYNQPMVDNYYWHPGYGSYPVVNITYNQAKAYCEWKTEELNNKLKAEGVTDVVVAVRMPTETEWEYAAYNKPHDYKERLESKKYLPNLFPYGEGLIDKKGYQANFGPVIDSLGFMFKGYIDDGGFQTVATHCYAPNEKGIYNMRGNVEEWVEASTEKTTVTEGFQKFMFPNANEANTTMQKCKGGSWADVPYYLMLRSEKVYPANCATPFTGFRVVVDVKEVTPAAQQ